MSSDDSKTSVDRRFIVQTLGIGVAASALSACSDRRGNSDAPITHDSPAWPDASAADASAADAGGLTPPQADASEREDGATAMRCEAGAAVARDLIDFHAHFLPKAYVDAAKAAGRPPDGLAEWPSWDLDQHLCLMDQAGIASSVLSISSPGVHFGDDGAASKLATMVNDEAIALASRVPDRLRFLASLPLPDVSGSITEWRRVRNAPGCLGAVVLSNSGGVYPGDSRFDPLWKELSSSSTRVLLHPTTPPDLLSVPADEPASTIEHYFETARACMDLFESTVLTRYPNIRFVIPHCGGALPIVLDRIRTFGLGGYTISADSTASQTKQLWFDSAGSPLPTQIPALLQQTTKDRLVYGSESCFMPSASVLAQLSALKEASALLSGGSWRPVLVTNGQDLLST